MALNGSKQDAIKLRRERVARLRLQQYTVREIAEKLAEDKIFNPHTGNAYGHVTIARDLQALNQEWLERSHEAISEHRAIQLAEIREAKRMAIEKGSVRQFLDAIALEMKLLGTPSPERIDITSKDNAIGLSPEVVMARVQQILDSVMERHNGD